MNVADRPARLDVHAHGMVVARLEERRERGPVLLRHTTEALDRWRFNLPVLSCSLPTTDEPQDATAFLDGFLPEGQARNDLAAARDVIASDTWMLLAEFGRDIAGAMAITDPDADLDGRRPGADAYSDEGLADAVEALPDRPLDVHDDSELSLAGVQHKLLLVQDGEGWARPTGGRPSTHILKPEPAAHPGLAALEAQALELARRVDLTTIVPRVLDVQGRPCLLVDRFDRAVEANGDLHRIHQEDLCQATGRDPRANARRGKYERHGGPGFLHAAELLRLHADDPRAELRRLVGAMVFTVLIGNSDAHGKNLSLLLDRPGRVRLAPLYDPVPTMLLDHLAVRCAMTINGVFESLERVRHGDLVAEAQGRFRWGLRAEETAAWVDEWIDRIVQGADPGEPVGAYVTQRARTLLDSRGT